MGRSRRLVVGMMVLTLGLTGLRAEDKAEGKKVSATDIAGKWEQVGGPEKVEFTTGRFTNQSGNFKFTGTYKVLEDGNIRMDVDGEAGKKLGPLVREIKVESDELTLSDPKGKTVHYRRPKEDANDDQKKKDQQKAAQ